MTWAYIAGFFDGEGSVTRNGSGFRVTIPQTNIEVLQTIQQFVGCGSVIHVTKRRSHWKESWTYAIAKQTEVLHFLKRIAPHLVVKRDLVRTIIPGISRSVTQYGRSTARREQRLRVAVALRRRGWTYRSIGRRVGMDWGWTRRMILRSHASPVSS